MSSTVSSMVSHSEENPCANSVQVRNILEGGKGTLVENLCKVLVVGKGISEGIPEGSGDGISSNDGSANDVSDDSTNEKRVTWAEIVKGNSSR